MTFLNTVSMITVKNGVELYLYSP